MHWFNSYLKLLNVNDGGVIRSLIEFDWTDAILVLYSSSKPFFWEKVMAFGGRYPENLINFKGFLVHQDQAPPQPGSESSHIPCHPLQDCGRCCGLPFFPVFFRNPSTSTPREFCFNKNSALQRWDVFYQKSAAFQKKKDVRLGDFGERNISWYWRLLMHFF